MTLLCARAGAILPFVMQVLPQGPASGVPMYVQKGAHSTTQERQARDDCLQTHRGNSENQSRRWDFVSGLSRVGCRVWDEVESLSNMHFEFVA